MVNEEISKETVDLAGRVTQLTVQEVMKILQKFVEDTKQNMKAYSNTPKHGKQSVKELIGQGQGVTAVDIEKTDLKDFQRIAKKMV